MGSLPDIFTELTGKFEEILGDLIDWIVSLSAGSSAPETPEVPDATTPPAAAE